MRKDDKGRIRKTDLQIAIVASDLRGFSQLRLSQGLHDVRSGRQVIKERELRINAQPSEYQEISFGHCKGRGNQRSSFGSENLDNHAVVGVLSVGLTVERTRINDEGHLRGLRVRASNSSA